MPFFGPIMFVLLMFFLLNAGSYAQKVLEEFRSHPKWKLIDLGEECGFSFSDRIIGGKQAALGQYPWIVRLGYATNDEGNVVGIYECGGAIISPRYVLTAAHCSTDHMRKNLLEVRIGEHYTESDPDCVDGECAPRVQDIGVEEESCHLNYLGHEEFSNDICLLRLQEPIVFSDFVQPICLPVFNNIIEHNFEGEYLEVAGWGHFSMGTESIFGSHTLLTVSVPVQSNVFCTEKYRGHTEIFSTQMCAGGEPGKDSCSGDSGGPLMKPFSINTSTRYFLIGIVSVGPKKCGVDPIPGIYTSVAKYITWILDNVYE
ncbi:CLIP domain-containing serine protease 2-like [Homalodisca vitripennis]|uniref:CLIP domain-containing serine protease 2-like n=1 Tax=Homalodisca vitripennis TaxID=197043 RepID=UPI001EEB0193|nr:CLIP domain-containing serine protease 2-like [Homalodisca vitripennis]